MLSNYTRFYTYTIFFIPYCIYSRASPTLRSEGNVICITCPRKKMNMISHFKCLK